MRSRPEAVQTAVVASGVLVVAVAVLLVLQALDPSLLNQVTGKLFENASMVTRVYVVNSSPAACDVDFPAGWNLVSFFCLSNGISVHEGLLPINGDYAAVFGYDPSLAKRWVAYNPSLPIWVVNDLSSLYRERGYWIYIVNETYYSQEGKKKSQAIIDLQPGWNLVGFPTNTTLFINQTLGVVLPSVIAVRSYNASVPSFTYYPPTVQTDVLGISLREFGPYYGFWIYVNASGSYTVS